MSRANRHLLLLVAAGLLSATAAVLILAGHRLLAGLPALGASAALFSVALGARERARWIEPSPGERDAMRAIRFAEGVLDRVFDASVLVPLAWVSRSGSNVDAFLALVGLGGSYLASYERARGGALGYRASESMAYRATRYATLTLGLLTGWLAPALWIFAALTVAAAAVRAWNVAIQERRSPSPRGTVA